MSDNRRTLVAPVTRGLVDTLVATYGPAEAGIWLRPQGRGQHRTNDRLQQPRHRKRRSAPTATPVDLPELHNQASARPLCGAPTPHYLRTLDLVLSAGSRRNDAQDMDRHYSIVITLMSMGSPGKAGAFGERGTSQRLGTMLGRLLFSPLLRVRTASLSRSAPGLGRDQLTNVAHAIGFLAVADRAAGGLRGR